MQVDEQARITAQLADHERGPDGVERIDTITFRITFDKTLKKPTMREAAAVFESGLREMLMSSGSHWGYLSATVVRIDAWASRGIDDRVDEMRRLHRYLTDSLRDEGAERIDRDDFRERMVEVAETLGDMLGVPRTVALADSG